MGPSSYHPIVLLLFTKELFVRSIYIRCLHFLPNILSSSNFKALVPTKPLRLHLKIINNLHFVKFKGWVAFFVS